MEMLSLLFQKNLVVWKPFQATLIFMTGSISFRRTQQCGNKNFLSMMYKSVHFRFRRTQQCGNISTLLLHRYIPGRFRRTQQCGNLQIASATSQYSPGFRRTQQCGNLLRVVSLYTPSLSFQKNLVVWKPRSRAVALRTFCCVSEELSSVETTLCVLLRRRSFKFQKNLVVWKQHHSLHLPVNSGKFQKNLVVWKRLHT